MIAGFRTRENGRRVESCPCKPGLPYTYFSGWFPNPGLTRFSYSGFSSFFTRVQDKQRDRRQRQKLDQRSYAQRLLLRLLPEGFSSSSLPSAKCFYTSRSKHARGSKYGSGGLLNQSHIELTLNRSDMRKMNIRGQKQQAPS